MIKVIFQSILPGFMAVICCCMLAACSNLPPSLAQSEEELIAYMHEYIIRQEIHPNFAYIPPTDQPGYVALPKKPDRFGSTEGGPGRSAPAAESRPTDPGMVVCQPPVVRRG